nr:retrotransposon protein, putative, Ty1-copia subclass [Tanacetum cinerariifolium]
MAARGQNHGKGKNKQAYAPKPKIPPPPKKEDPAKDSICHECGEIEHWKRNCPKYLDELLKKKKNAASRAGGSGSKGKAFEKCVSCMSGKMARKPYTHQVERAKDLLGLIHTDVYGLFKIMSRQGASYFITFTDDFNRYGYVYLLKNKHEVFETFKVFQKEVENQLGSWGYRPSYSSLHFTTQWCVGEENRTLLDMVRSMMSQTTLPKSFLDYALETVVRILKMVPTKKVEKTPYEVHKDTTCPDRMCLYIDAEEHELGDFGEPTKYKAALLDPESEKWLNAMNVEMKFIKGNEVLVLVELPPNGKTVGSKWLFRKKTGMDGNVHTYKDRLEAKGHTQTPRIDSKEIFSPVADIRAIRILIAIAAYYDYEFWQMDVKTAFFNGYLNEEVYMEQPEGFVNPKYLNRVCKLKRSIYGLKQASRQFNK